MTKASQSIIIGKPLTATGKVAACRLCNALEAVAIRHRQLNIVSIAHPRALNLELTGQGIREIELVYSIPLRRRGLQNFLFKDRPPKSPRV